MDGLRMLTKGTPAQKLKFLFDVYDVDGMTSGFSRKMLVYHVFVKNGYCFSSRFYISTRLATLQFQILSFYLSKKSFIFKTKKDLKNDCDTAFFFVWQIDIHVSC